MHYKRSLHFALVLSSAGLLVGLFIENNAIGDYSWFTLYTTLSTFVSAFFVWFLIIELPAKHTSQVS